MKPGLTFSDLSFVKKINGASLPTPFLIHETPTNEEISEKSICFKLKKVWIICLSISLSLSQKLTRKRNMDLFLIRIGRRNMLHRRRISENRLRVSTECSLLSLGRWWWWCRYSGSLLGPRIKGFSSNTEECAVSLHNFLMSEVFGVFLLFFNMGHSRPLFSSFHFSSQ